MLDKLFWKLAFKRMLKDKTGLKGKAFTDAYINEVNYWTLNTNEWKDWSPKDAVEESLYYWSE